VFISLFNKKKSDLPYSSNIIIGNIYIYCNCKIYILDKYMKPISNGVEGEIYIRGYGIGKGYLNRPKIKKKII